MTQSTTIGMEGTFWKLEKGRAPFLGCSEQPALVDMEPPLSGGCLSWGRLQSWPAPWRLSQWPVVKNTLFSGSLTPSK